MPGQPVRRARKALRKPIVWPPFEFVGRFGNEFRADCDKCLNQLSIHVRARGDAWACLCVSCGIEFEIERGEKATNAVQHDNNALNEKS